jgi:benzoylformate decarboxylase
MDIVDPTIDYQAMARSMGVPSCQVTRAADIAPAIEASLASGGPSLVEIMIAAG